MYGNYTDVERFSGDDVDGASECALTELRRVSVEVAFGEFQHRVVSVVVTDVVVKRRVFVVVVQRPVPAVVARQRRRRSSVVLVVAVHVDDDRVDGRTRPWRH